jgi:hypothetical protein
VFADWLDENGQPGWAEYIRREVKFARLAVGDPIRMSSVRRQPVECNRLAHIWAGAEPGRYSNLKPYLERGFVKALCWDDATISDWPAVARILHEHPVRKLIVRGQERLSARTNASALDLSDLAELFVADPALSPLKCLILNSVAGDLAVGLSRLGEAPSLTGLHGLHMDNEITDAVMRRVVGGGLAPTLKRLSITLADDCPAACGVLANSQLGGRLAGLELGDGLTNDGLRAAFGGRIGLELKSFSVCASRLTPGAADLFVGWAAKLDEFTLSGGLPDAAVATILSAPSVATATRLHLEFLEEPSPAAITALVDPRRPAPIRDLTFLQVPVEDDGFARLIEAKSTARLVKLSVYGACHYPDRRLTDVGARALASSQNVQALAHLTLQAQAIGPIGVAALAASPYLTSLRELDLSECSVEDAGATALASAVFGDRLESLDLSGADVTDDGAKALAAAAFPRLEKLFLTAEFLSPLAQLTMTERFAGVLTLL